MVPVHAEEVAGEEGGFFAACAGSDFEDGVAVVVRALAEDHVDDFGFQRVVFFLEIGDFRFREFAQFGVLVGVVGDFSVVGEFFFDVEVVGVGFHRLCQGAAFAHVVADLGIGADGGIGQFRVQLFEAGEAVVEFRFHFCVKHVSSSEHVLHTTAQ